jgi:hypothetical protein
LRLSCQREKWSIKLDVLKNIAHHKKHIYFLSAFSFDAKGAKEKANKKKTPKGEFRSLRRATAVSPAARDKLLKKFDQNFSVALPKTLVFVEDILTAE